MNNNKFTAIAFRFTVACLFFTVLLTGLTLGLAISDSNYGSIATSDSGRMREIFSKYLLISLCFVFLTIFVRKDSNIFLKMINSVLLALVALQCRVLFEMTYEFFLPDEYVVVNVAVMFLIMGILFISLLLIGWQIFDLFVFLRNRKSQEIK
jgi:hypothetical protein